MSKYGIELYSTLEAETGLATGWKQCGSVNVARTPERWMVLKKQAALARSFGVEVQLITPQRSRRSLPGDAHRRSARRDVDSRATARPTRPTCACRLAKGARNRGVKHRRGRRGHRRDRRERRGRQAWPACAPRRATCAARCWSTAPASGRASSARWPASTCRCIRPSTSTSSPSRIEGVHPMLPVMRDPDGFIYYKEEVGGLVMGGFEPQAKPWTSGPDPEHVPVPAARRGLGPVRDPDDQRDPPHAVPGDRAGQDAAQRAGELHARRQFHPRRGARAAQLFRLRRLQLGRHRQLAAAPGA